MLSDLLSAYSSDRGRDLLKLQFQRDELGLSQTAGEDNFYTHSSGVKEKF